MVHLVICMGSSCFSRGNNRNLETIRQWLSMHGYEANVELKGCRCGGHCGDGPNIWINGIEHQGVTPASIPALLSRTFAGKV